RRLLRAALPARWRQRPLADDPREPAEQHCRCPARKVPAMIACTPHCLSRRWLLAALGLVLALVLGLLGLWLSFKSSAELDGRYHSGGQVQLSNGEVLDISQALQISDGRFYAMTRQGDSILETSGAVEYGFLGRYRLRVAEGQVTGL